MASFVKLLCAACTKNVTARACSPGPTRLITRYVNTGPDRFQQQKVEVDGIHINYEMVGQGSHKVLCIPGAFGTIQSDFGPQLQKLNRDKFTIIALDPPGYGLSRPPERKFTVDYLHRDAEYAAKFMQILGFLQFSVLGWSDGGMSALIMAAQHPHLVSRLVVWGSNSYVTEKDLENLENIRYLSDWSERMRVPLEAAYGADVLAKMCNEFVDIFYKIYYENDGDIFKDDVQKVSCPTLIVHGMKDPLVLLEHAEYLHKHIKQSRLYVMENGKHNLHLRYAVEFNKLVEDFLLEEIGNIRH